MGKGVKLRLFISHAYDEASVALSLKAQIEADFLGLVKVFVSSNRHDLFAGADWLTRLRNEVAATEIFGVLCSDRSLTHPWVNIEVGAAFFRENQPIIIPLCHSDLNAGLLEPPLNAKQAITITAPEGIQALYELLAHELGSTVPPAPFQKIAERLKATEKEYIENSRQTEKSARLPIETSIFAGVMINDPAVLCISSNQYEEYAKKEFELIRKYLPANLNHKVVVTSDEVRKELGPKVYDIIHLALYICPHSGDLIFSDIDSETKIAKTDHHMTALDFSKLIEIARTSLLVVTAPEPLSFVAKLLPYTNIVFPSGPIPTESLANWLSAFYDLLSQSYALSDACKRASAQYCSCMMLYPKLQAASEVKYDLTSTGITAAR